jgi:hypothetical protein
VVLTVFHGKRPDTPTRARRKNTLPMPAAFGRTTEIFFKICAIFNGSKMTGSQHFIILTRQRLFAASPAGNVSKSCSHFSHTHLTETAFFGILSVSRGRRAEIPAFFRLFCIYRKDNLWQP